MPRPARFLGSFTLIWDRGHIVLVRSMKSYVEAPQCHGVRTFIGSRNAKLRPPGNVTASREKGKGRSIGLHDIPFIRFV